MVKAIEREGGFERVDRRWSRPLCFFTAVPTGKRDTTVIYDILNFFHAVGGQSNGFRFKDYTDFRSGPVYATPTADDQVFEVVTGGYQLVKQYVAGNMTQLREIYRPKASTLLVKDSGGTVHTDYTIDETTGILTPGGGWTPASWGGEFDLWCRFTSDVSMVFEEGQEGTEGAILSANFTLRERRPNE